MFSITQKAKPQRKWRIFVGDEVVVVSGQDKGKTGKILKIDRRNEQVLVDGVNLQTEQAQYDSKEAYKGEYVTQHLPVNSWDVNLLDPVLKKPTRIKVGYLEDGTMVRICKKSGVILPKPERPKKQAKAPKDLPDGPLDTNSDDVLKLTYKGEDYAAVDEDFKKFIDEKKRIENLLVFKN